MTKAFYLKTDIAWAHTAIPGKYRGLQGNPCNENRDPEMRTGVLCNENRFFPVVIDSQGVPCELYRVWVCSVLVLLHTFKWPTIE